jgi:hypothetical protein
MESRSLNLDSLAQFSDWLQRKLSSEVNYPEILSTLAEFGRAKRIRNAAKRHLATPGAAGANHDSQGLG